MMMLAFSILPSCNNPSLNTHINAGIPMNHLMDSLHVKANQLHILIDKSDRKLMVMHDSSCIKSYPVVLGFNPVDDKRKQGDGCTPEGEFSIISKYPHKSWNKFIWINYPNEDSRRKHAQAKEKGEIPKSAKIGGEIGIHGVPRGYDYAIDKGIDWTHGCISMHNDDLNEVYALLTKTSVILIQK